MTIVMLIPLLYYCSTLISVNVCMSRHILEAFDPLLVIAVVVVIVVYILPVRTRVFVDMPNGALGAMFRTRRRSAYLGTRLTRKK